MNGNRHFLLPWKHLKLRESHNSVMNIPQEEENELDALQSAKELEEEKKKDKERQAKLVR